MNNVKISSIRLLMLSEVVQNKLNDAYYEESLILRGDTNQKEYELIKKHIADLEEIQEKINA